MQLAAIESVHVATYIEQLSQARSAPTAKLRLAALRHLFDWMVIGQIMPTNPAAGARAVSLGGRGGRRSRAGFIENRRPALHFGKLEPDWRLVRPGASLSLAHGLGDKPAVVCKRAEALARDDR